MVGLALNFTPSNTSFPFVYDCYILTFIRGNSYYKVCMYQWRTGRSCVFKNFVHLVFVTKYRRRVFTYSMIERLKELFTETCQQMDVELIEFGAEDDHVHIMLNVPPKIAISNLVAKLKGKSSYFLRREFAEQLQKKLWGNNLWSSSYCVVSAGGAPLDVVKQYIANQRTPTSDINVAKSKKLTKKQFA